MHDPDDAAGTLELQKIGAAFDAAAIRFHRMYSRADALHDGDADRAARMKAAEDVARLWDEWRKLFLGDDEPRPAA